MLKGEKVAEFREVAQLVDVALSLPIPILSDNMPPQRTYGNKEKLLPTNELELIESHIKELKYDNFNKYFKKKNSKTITDFMMKDKKNKDKNINLILLKKISKPVLKNTYSQIKVKNFISSLINK